MRHPRNASGTRNGSRARARRWSWRDRHVIEKQRVRAHALLQTEVLAGVSGVDCRDFRLDALTVGNGMISNEKFYTATDFVASATQ
jgi:hypothetical protein